MPRNERRNKDERKEQNVIILFFERINEKTRKMREREEISKKERTEEKKRKWREVKTNERKRGNKERERKRREKIKA